MKTKWNWGTKLAIWIAAFVVFILVLVYTSFNYDVNLVEKDYYPKGLMYQSRINAIENASNIGAEFIISQNNENLNILMPDILSDSGTIMFFRPSDISWDRTYKLLSVEGNTISIPSTDFTNGKYIVKFNWWHNNMEYYVEQVYTIK